ncbi:DUF4429 domain-containing protein [Streptomyces sp. NBC_00984]|uniref:DUF4429 domain-containing protein n=1 Tax=Streptomyces sp. NBC_00984 TaxID=2903700 RepID=UPI00386E5429|nr:DUF4429 domain-containing protein [Streptomyces sp. NBC_00984]
MTEITQRDGTWTFDGETVRIVPGRGKGIHPLRQELGECVVPLRALAGISFEPDRKGGRLRLRLRDGACPVLRAADGRLRDAADPYQLTVEKDRSGLAEYFVDEVRSALLVEQVPTGAVDGFLLPGPAVPVAGGGGDGTASFDGETVRLTWNWKANEVKTSGGPVAFPVSEVTGVHWVPAIGLENGHLRFVRREGPAPAPAAEDDPYSLDLWGLSKKEYTAALVAAAVLVRLPAGAGPAPAEITAPAAPAAPAPAASSGDDHDVLLRRLRELGELHRSGVLTDDEFSAAKQAVLKRL